MLNFSFVFKLGTFSLVLGFFFLLWLAFQKFCYKYLLKIAETAKWQWVTFLLPLCSPYTIYWFMLLGIYFANPILFPLPITLNINHFLAVFFIITLMFAASKITTSLIANYQNKIQTTLAMSGLVKNILQITIFAIGTIMILGNLGVSITPLLATLGIGGLAIALALQDTLSNFFAGCNIILAKQIKIGDYIKLDTGNEGYVEDINWRITKIKSPSNNIILIPNNKVSQSTITNFHLPEKETNIAMEINIHYDNDLEKVEKVIMTTLNKLAETTEEISNKSKPTVKFSEFGNSGIKTIVALQIKEFTKQAKVKHELIKLIHKKFNEEKIIIPYFFNEASLKASPKGVD